VLLSMISSALNLRNIPGYYQYLALGLLLLLALALDSVRNRIRSALATGGTA
jgi:ribose transport system permease protein